MNWHKTNSMDAQKLGPLLAYMGEGGKGREREKEGNEE